MISPWLQADQYTTYVIASSGFFIYKPTDGPIHFLRLLDGRHMAGFPYMGDPGVGYMLRHISAKLGRGEPVFLCCKHKKGDIYFMQEMRGVEGITGQEVFVNHVRV